MKNLVTLFLILFPLYLFAQNTDQCGCNAVLVDGIYNYRFKLGDTKSYAALKRFISSQSYQEFMNAEGTDAGVFYQDIGLSFNDNEEEYNRKINKFKSETIDIRKYDRFDVLIEEFGDENVLNAWSKCKENCDKGLFSISFKPQAGGERYVLNINYNSTTGLRYATIKSSEVRNADLIGRISGTPDGKLFPDGHVITSYEGITLSHVDKDLGIDIHFRIDELGDTEVFSTYIPPYVKPFEKINAPIPIVNIQKHFVDETNFQICDSEMEKLEHRNDFKWTSSKSSHCSVMYRASVELPDEYIDREDLKAKFIWSSIRNNSTMSKDVHKLMMMIGLAAGDVAWEEKDFISFNQLVKIFSDETPSSSLTLDIPKDTQELTVFFWCRDRANEESCEIELLNFRLELYN